MVTVPLQLHQQLRKGDTAASAESEVTANPVAAASTAIGTTATTAVKLILAMLPSRFTAMKTQM